MSRRYVIKRDRPSRFEVDYSGDLDPEQYSVVTATGGPMLVIAGAGSGKTRAVTYRVARLVESGVPPSRILLVTFTNKAAREMLQRVEALVRSDLRRVWGGTFHSIANRVLRRHADSIGYRSNFSIIDSEDASELIGSSARDAGIDHKARRFPEAGLLADIFSFARNRDLGIKECVEKHFPHFESVAHQIEHVSHLFQERKLRRNLMDYDDLLINWRAFLSDRSDIRDYWAGQFEHILVDEYQDTNKIQADIVDILASRHRNVMVVGDDAQAIFGWRGAHFENIYNFKERYPDAVEFRLETNYRSRPELVMLANSSIKHNKKQFEKNLRAKRSSIDILPALVPLRDSDQQASFIAGRVLELRQEGIALEEIGILYRSHWNSLELQLELARRDIPYVIRSGVRFFEQAHVKDVISYLRIAINPRDESAWKRILRQIEGIGKATADRLWERISESAEPFSEIRERGFVGRAAALRSWQEFVRTVDVLINEGNFDRPGMQIEAVMSSPYAGYLNKTYKNPELRVEDLRQLAGYANRFDSTEAFLSELALINTERFGPPRGTVGEDVVMGSDEDEKLTLSSIHQAKGLEWKVVFLIWAADGKLPAARSLRDADGEEEERRLFYVAVTRAKDELYICYPVIAATPRMGTVIQKPSRFVTEVATALFQIWKVEEEGERDFEGERDGLEGPQFIN